MTTHNVRHYHLATSTRTSCCINAHVTAGKLSRHTGRQFGVPFPTKDKPVAVRHMVSSTRWSVLPQQCLHILAAACDAGNNQITRSTLGTMLTTARSSSPRQHDGWILPCRWSPTATSRTSTWSCRSALASESAASPSGLPSPTRSRAPPPAVRRAYVYVQMLIGGHPCEKCAGCKAPLSLSKASAGSGSVRQPHDGTTASQSLGLAGNPIEAVSPTECLALTCACA